MSNTFTFTERHQLFAASASHTAILEVDAQQNLLDVAYAACATLKESIAFPPFFACVRYSYVLEHRIPHTAHRMSRCPPSLEPSEKKHVPA